MNINQNYKEKGMVKMRISNWTITDDEIRWSGEPAVDYSISRERITETGPGNRSNMFDWLVHLPEKSWLTKEDIYALNTAFVYALELYGYEFSNDISFISTFEEQDKELKDKQKEAD